MILSKSQLAQHTRINESLQKSVQCFSASTAQTSVFLSHKHSDKLELKRVKKLLEELGISVYIDWLDDSMPEKTRGETGVIIKQKIKDYDKFILVATEDAIKSQWCNWELGLGDAVKYDKDKIALFPLRNDGYSAWSGTEYMEIYPTIEYEDGTGKYVGGAYIPQGYYVMYPSLAGIRNLIKLEDWLKR